MDLGRAGTHRHPTKAHDRPTTGPRKVSAMTATVPSPASPPSRPEDGQAPGRVPVVLATSSPLVRGGLQIMLGNRPELRIVTGPPAPPARLAPTGRERHAPGAVLFDAGEPEAAYAEVVADARGPRAGVRFLEVGAHCGGCPVPQ